MNIALMCMAKDEDNYIEEWIDYHFKLGFDKIFIYQNEWKYNNVTNNQNIIIKDWIGNSAQYKIGGAYDDFIQNNYNNFDWVFFLDVDEFLNIPGCYNLKEFMDNEEIQNAPHLGIHWKLFGDSGLTGVTDGNYSVLGRFIKCQKELHTAHKSAVNLNITKNRVAFISQGHVPSRAYDGYWTLNMTNQNDGRYGWDGFKHIYCSPDIADKIYINHYNVKTKEEFMNNKQKRNINLDPALYHNFEQNFINCNKNEDEDTTIKRFYFEGIK